MAVAARCEAPFPCLRVCWDPGHFIETAITLRILIGIVVGDCSVEPARLDAILHGLCIRCYAG